MTCLVMIAVAEPVANGHAVPVHQKSLDAGRTAILDCCMSNLSLVVSLCHWSGQHHQSRAWLV